MIIVTFNAVDGGVGKTTLSSNLDDKNRGSVAK